MSNKKCVNIAVLTVSDSRTDVDDKWGQVLVDLINGAGHHLVEKKIIKGCFVQDIGNFGIDSLDMAGMLKTDDPDIKKFQMAWLGAPGMRIAGGTDEILRNIIAERVLGLPQEPRADKGLAYKDIPSGNS